MMMMSYICSCRNKKEFGVLQGDIAMRNSVYNDDDVEFAHLPGAHFPRVTSHSFRHQNIQGDTDRFHGFGLRNKRMDCVCVG